MAPSSGELWGHHFMPTKINVDCLMPNGVIVTLKCIRESRLETIKEDLWKEARNYPLYQVLAKDPNMYIFVSVTLDAEREEFYDESKRLCDLRLFQPVLKLVEPKGNKEEKMLNYDIGIAIGIHVHDLDEMKDQEIADYRRRSFEICQKANSSRADQGNESLALYAYPPEIENKPDLPRSMLDKLDQGKIRIAVWFWSRPPQKEKQKCTVSVMHNSPPEDIIREAVLKKLRSSESYSSAENKEKVLKDSQDICVLKVAGSDQYFLKKCPISQYKYIRACIARNDVPQLALMSKEGIYKTLPKGDLHKPAYIRKSIPPPVKKTKKLWHIDAHFKVLIESATYVNVQEADQLYVRVGIYHGTEAICQVKETKMVSHSSPSWDEWIEFEDMFTLDLPRAAKLCLSICSVKRRKNRDETTMLCWGNISLFDWRSFLQSGPVSLNLWAVPRGLDDLLYPLGLVGSNTKIKDSPCLKLKFEFFKDPVVYPDMEEFKDYGEFIQGTNTQQDKPQEKISPAEKEMLEDIARRDPLAEISEQEKMTLWRLRNYCKDVPDILPRFLDGVKWNARNEITHLYLLLENWPPVAPQTALELLDCKYADPVVRSMAVKWLDTISDEDLAQYLLQLVQTLKYEPYLDNPLSNLLLRRALLNKKIGHFFFWHLKAELHSQAVWVRFGLLLESFCRGLGPHLRPLIKQVEAMDKLTKLTDSIKDKFNQESMKERMKYMCEKIEQEDYVKSLENFQSPLENSVTLGELDITQCRIVDSAKKPLWLVWRNPDELADQLHEYHAIIFKNGDDLRQDMLTLQGK